jgi:hypothetical protein
MLWLRSRGGAGNRKLLRRQRSGERWKITPVYLDVASTTATAVQVPLFACRVEGKPLTTGATAGGSGGVEIETAPNDSASPERDHGRDHAGARRRDRV